jgi:hypothetical protein
MERDHIGASDIGTLGATLTVHQNAGRQDNTSACQMARAHARCQKKSGGSTALSVKLQLASSFDSFLSSYDEAL